MKSSQFIMAIVLALVTGVVAYIISNSLGKDATTIALGASLGALFANVAATILSKNTTSSNNNEVKTLYVGNLPYRANEAAVRTLFSTHGVVHSVRLMKDKHTGKRRGFGFVEMAAADSESAISALNDSEFQQRTLKVREAKERPEKTEAE
ncbi:RNA-binding protein [Thalassotalea sp. M1531]|uniref:RNA-binding protein n=1 Tax=Thalassotalea algicola TaxID=2716224 RepID=A0A7Y0LGY5_9GAMM|nr:RNA-binding protein [Thalassotalea algicola]NMP33511.1 RNA-binding protein [Thalassotalea algicola]